MSETVTVTSDVVLDPANATTATASEPAPSRGLRATVLAGDLARELALLAPFAPARAAHPILTHVLIEVSNAGVHLTATDLDIRATSNQISADVASKGRLCVPLRALLAIVRRLPKRSLVVLTDIDGRIVIRNAHDGRNTTITLATLPAKDFPEPKDNIPVAPLFTVAYEDLRAGLKAGRPAISTEEMRLQLQGALLTHVDGVLRVLATDGHRAMVVTIPGPEAAQKTEILLPVDVIGALLRLSPTDRKALVTIYRGKAYGIITIEQRELAWKLEERRFPDVDKVIAKEDGWVTMRLQRLRFLEAVLLMRSCANRNDALALKLLPHGLSVSAFKPDLGELEDVIPMVMCELGFEEKAFSVALNSRYVEQYLTTVESDEIDLTVQPQADCQTQVHLRPVTLGRLISSLLVIMPMRL